MQRPGSKRIKPVRWFVQYQQCRVVQHRANQREFLFHALGIIHRKLPQGLGEFQLFQQRLCSALNLFSA